MDVRFVLYFMTAFAGFVMVVGGMWLIYKQKIFIDKESNQPVEVRLPGNVSLRSNYPALVLFVLGFYPLIYPINKLSQLDEFPHVVKLRLTGAPSTNVYPVLVYAAAEMSAVARDGDSFSVPISFIGPGEEQYKVLLIANEHLIDARTVTKADRNKDVINVDFRGARVFASDYKTTSVPIPAAYK